MFKGSTPADTDAGAGIIGQLLQNDIANKLIDDTAVLASGITKGKVVKYNATNQNWGLCDGTVALAATDVVGIVEYANGTSGQVRISGIYTDTSLTTNAAYYCQSNGSLGTTVTKVFIGRVTSPGRLCMPAGGGGSTNSGSVPPGGSAVPFTGTFSGVNPIDKFTGDIRTDWQICNGTNGTPDLRDRFILAAGTTYAAGTTGGEATHVLTINEMPSHVHAINGTNVTSGGSKLRNVITTTGGIYITGTTDTTDGAGSGAAHNNMPPYYALAYIMRIA